VHRLRLAAGRLLLRFFAPAPPCSSGTIYSATAQTRTPDPSLTGDESGDAGLRLTGRTLFCYDSGALYRDEGRQPSSLVPFSTYDARTTLLAPDCAVVEMGRAAVRPSESICRCGTEAGPICGSVGTWMSGGEVWLGLYAGASPPDDGKDGDGVLLGG
jgi:hypothetical protein